MPKSQIDPAALLAAAIAGALALMLLPGAYLWLSSIGGLSLFLVVFSFDREGYRSFFQSLAFATVAAFCLTVASCVPFAFLAGSGELHVADPRIASQWLPLTWAGATVMICAMDRVRMSTRENVTETFRPTRTEARSFMPTFTPPPAPPQQAAPPPISQAAPPPPPQPAPPPMTPPAPSAFPSSATTWAAATPVPVNTETAVWSAPQPVRNEAIFAPAPVAPPSTPTPVPSTPQAVPVPRSGKETMIYVTLMDEGLNVLRSVRAEHVGRDFYRIVDEMPAGETWQFQPGQIVRCKKKNLSSGKALVATEEAPRAN